MSALGQSRRFWHVRDVRLSGHFGLASKSERGPKGAISRHRPCTWMEVTPAHFGELSWPKSVAPSRNGLIILRTILRHAYRRSASILAYHLIHVLDCLRSGPPHTREQPGPRLSPDLAQTLHFETTRNTRNVVDRDISLRPLDPAEVGAVDAALVGQCFLAEPGRAPRPCDTMTCCGRRAKG
jgi:hypothetical protein